MTVSSVPGASLYFHCIDRDIQQLEETAMPTQLFDLTGRVALVTGGSKGLGKSMARGFAQAGADVMISSRHEDELRETAAELASLVPSRIEWVVADMVDRSDVDALSGAALQRLGRV